MGELTYVQKLEKDYLRIESKNKRYREALENIRTVKYDDEFNPYAYMMLEIIEWAEEALEGESNE